MNHPATRDPFGLVRSAGCCYHPWNSQALPVCRLCARPASSFHLCGAPDALGGVFADSDRNHQAVLQGRVSPRTSFRYRTHPPTAARSPSVNSAPAGSCVGSPGRSLARSSPSTTQRPPGLDHPDRWIGEETRRSLRPHVYKYYLGHVQEYRRQNMKVSLKA
ncbi:uncharacterized protein LOC124293631 [Neodiprion lecontei]|uniref:Uncharacterized protein LOC124293631 n=1 Tax=Neodiprion lecontei TaxID=441921 RepID=A0ABM3FSW1_NEOLC|nr:uncharacterized protein LOC124293631 [Neodiprion lecontei]